MLLPSDSSSSGANRGPRGLLGPKQETRGGPGAQARNWLTYQLNNDHQRPQGATTTTTRHFTAWEQTTTTYPTGRHSHPLLAAASVSSSLSPVIRPIPNRLASPPISLTPEAKPLVYHHIKTERRNPDGVAHDGTTDGNDSAFEDWDSSLSSANCSRTTPVNHKSLRQWQSSRLSATPMSNYGAQLGEPISILTSSSGVQLGEPISIMTSSPGLGVSGQLSSSSWSSLFSNSSPASSESSGMKHLKSETVTSDQEDSKTSIPIGIAVGRQRDLKTPPRPTPPLPQQATSSSSTLASLASAGPYWPPMWPLAYQPGYQDPLTGQVFFVPGFNPMSAALWPSPAPPPPSAPIGLTPFQQSLMQLQQESWLQARQGFLYQHHHQQQQSPLLAAKEEPRPKADKTLQRPESVEIKVHEDVLSVGEPELDPVGLHILAESIEKHEKERRRPSRLGLLCDAAFLSDDEGHLKNPNDESLSSSKSRSKSLDCREYQSPKAETKAKAFIASKSNKGAIAKSQTQMDEWEAKMRGDLAVIQKRYKEKYKELLQLKPPTSSPSKLSSNKKTTLAPIIPWLKPTKASPSPVSSPHTSSSSNNGLDLSTINSKFRSARPNPFENLLKLTSSKPSAPEEDAKNNVSSWTPKKDAFLLHDTKTGRCTPVSPSTNTKTPKAEPILKTSTPLSCANIKREVHLISPVSPIKKEVSINAANNDRSPKKQEVSKLDTPTIVKKEAFLLKEDLNVDADVSDAEEEEQPLPKMMLKIRKQEKKAKKEKKEKHKHHRHHHHKHHKKRRRSTTCDDDDIHEPIQGPESCLIKQDDLEEGLRVLVKLDGHFHPGKIQAISPPDIYGVLVDKERGNKPHIFSREEVLNEAIFEVRPHSVDALTIGTRVCAYWSQKYNHLYPGTISDIEIDPKLDSNYVNVELDDGDNRDIHVDSIRFLPPNYPLVVHDPDPLMTTLHRRKRRQSWASFSPKTPRSSFDTEPLQKKSKQNIVGVKQESKQSHVVREDGSIKPSLDPECKQSLKMRIHVGSQPSKQPHANTKVVRKANLAPRPSISSSSDSEIDGSKNGGIASFLPKDQVWKWADKGQKRAKGRIYHKLIERKDEKLGIGDSAVFLSTNCPDQPYIGRLESMWETASGNKNVGVRWYYHLAELNVKDRKSLNNLLQPKGALFESNHYDENDVQTISHRCDVVKFDDFRDETNDNESNDKYYLAGSHDAIEKRVQFMPGVLKQTDDDQCK